MSKIKKAHNYHLQTVKNCKHVSWGQTFLCGLLTKYPKQTRHQYLLDEHISALVVVSYQSIGTRVLQSQVNTFLQYVAGKLRKIPLFYVSVCMFLEVKDPSRMNGPDGRQVIPLTEYRHERTLWYYYFISFRGWERRRPITFRFSFLYSSFP